MIGGYNMEKENVFKQLRVIIEDCGESGDTLNYTRYSSVNGDRQELLLNTLYLLLNTGYMCSSTREYLRDRRETFETLASKYNKMAPAGKDISVGGMRKRIWRDKEKFVTDFGESFVSNLLYKDDLDVEQYLAKTLKLIAYETQGGLLGNIELDLSNKQGILNEDITDEEFEEFISVVRPYIKAEKQRVQEGLNVNTLAYIEYITNHQSIADIDKDRLDRLGKLILG